MIDERWWEGGSVYQIYVRSWQDSDGDGYGDLAGVASRLDHLSWLGVDALWLTPTMPSPDVDWGYDVSDYRSVHPDLGTLEDLDHLVAEAARRNIKVLLDLVPNHTSDAHPWFVESRAGRDSPKRDWYVWADPRPDGSPPTNWLDATGASAWTFDPSSGQYYLHNFLPGQPDLNWWNEELRAEFEDILRFWFDRGVDGFRIDVAHALYHDRDLRDNPPAPEGPETRFGQQRAFSMNRPEVHQVYRDWRKLADSYQPGRLLLGETWVFDPERLAAFYGEDDQLHLGFNFALLFSEFDAGSLSGVVREFLSAMPERACPAWTGSNHDVSRFPTRWAGGDPDRARLALAVLCTLPGTTILYAGDELGLTDVDVAPEDQRDPMTWRAEDGRFNRDRARTPMPWVEDPDANFGFCPSGTRPWLPLGDRRGSSVEAQLADPGSLLWLTRHLLRLRRASVSVRDYEQLPSRPQLWVYRSGDLVVAANFSASPAECDLPAGPVALSSRRGGTANLEGGRPRSGPTVLEAWEAIIVQTAGGRTVPGTKES